MKRREFITLLGSATAIWPLAARAQSERLRRVGILMPFPESDTEGQTRVRAFKQELQRLGWIEGSKVQFDERWTTDNMDLVRANAASLLELKPDLIVASGNRVIPILKQMTREVPIIIAAAVDPVGAGLVASLAHPGGNITGFSILEVSVIGKMLALLKQIAPKVSRSALIYNPDIPSTVLYERSFKAAATSLAVEPIVAHIHGMADIERAYLGTTRAFQLENLPKFVGADAYVFGEEAWVQCFGYLERIEEEIAVYVRRRATPEWLHLYRRLSVSLSPNLGNKTDAVTTFAPLPRLNM